MKFGQLFPNSICEVNYIVFCWCTLFFLISIDIVFHYYDQVHDKFYIYLEYVSGGSMDKILNQYGNLGESAIRSYTMQILAGLAYLHAKHTVHR